MSARLNWFWCDGLAAAVLVGMCATLVLGWLP